MKNYFLLFIFMLGLTACVTRPHQTEVETTVSKKEDPGPKRTTRRSLEEESMLGEGSGSLWNGRGQASYLFVNNNQRLLGDLLNVNIDGYPKEQIQMKVNSLAKLLAGILNDQRQEIKVKDEEEQKKKAPPAPEPPAKQEDVQQRGLASTTPAPAAAPAPAAKPVPVAMSPEAEKQIKKITEEVEEVESLQKAKDFPIRSVPTRVVDIQKDGSYKVRGEKPFYIGKREYKLVVAGTVKADDFDDKGVSAETLMEPTFDVTSDKKVEAL